MVEIDPPETQSGRDVVELVRRGDLILRCVLMASAARNAPRRTTWTPEIRARPLRRSQGNGGWTDGVNMRRNNATKLTVDPVVVVDTREQTPVGFDCLPTVVAACCGPRKEA